jgi:hypothetical protein
MGFVLLLFCIAFIPDVVVGVVRARLGCYNASLSCYSVPLLIIL